MFNVLLALQLLPGVKFPVAPRDTRNNLGDMPRNGL
jgi:hypothetical protein